MRLRPSAHPSWCREASLRSLRALVATSLVVGPLACSSEDSDGLDGALMGAPETPSAVSSPSSPASAPGESTTAPAQTPASVPSPTPTTETSGEPSSTTTPEPVTPPGPSEMPGEPSAGGSSGMGGSGGRSSGGAGGAMGGGAGTSSVSDGGAAGADGVGGEMGQSAGAGGMGGSDSGGDGPNVDRSQQQLFQLQFRANEADSAAGATLGNQYAYLDTRAEPAGKLVVYLHGAGSFNDCGNLPLGTMVAGWGFHWFAPCFSSNYGVDNCGDDIEGCRMEAFEGQDHHPFVNISRPDSIEERIVQGLRYLQQELPAGDWDYFLDGDLPRWSEIIITGHSHGASSSGVIGMHRNVFRVVMLAGPYDPGQAWLSNTPITSPDRFYGFTHSGDGQHQGHLDAFAALGLPGQPVTVDGAQPPYSDSHRLFSSAGVGDAHQSVTTGDVAAFEPVWHYLYAE